jgi:hypothetical protein
MIKYFSILILICGISCRDNKSVIRDYVTIKIYPYEHENKMKASAMPELKANSELMMYSRRFEYLLINIPEIHLPGTSEERNEIFNLYPDTLEMKRRYLEKYVQDKKLAEYFEETIAPITNPDTEINKTYTVDELMEVASKFFYCDEIAPDTSIQAHVCVGLNGVKEANWVKDYTLLEAFCYEGIFNDFDRENSQIWDSFVSKKKTSCELFRMKITTLNQYLEHVKLDLFEKMKNDEILKRELLDYYELNKTNLAFKIIN